MKKLLLAITFGSAFAANAGSFQLGTVTELSISHQNATFQLDTSADNIDIRETCLDPSKPLNFIIDFNSPGGKMLFDSVADARKTGSKLAVNGDGICIGDEFEGVGSINPQ